jgi:hypothetical protein
VASPGDDVPPGSSEVLAGMTFTKTVQSMLVSEGQSGFTIRLRNLSSTLPVAYRITVQK